MIYPMDRASKTQVEKIEYMKQRFTDAEIVILQKKLDDWAKKHYTVCKCCGHVEKNT